MACGPLLLNRFEVLWSIITFMMKTKEPNVSSRRESMRKTVCRIEEFSRTRGQGWGKEEWVGKKRGEGGRQVQGHVKPCEGNYGEGRRPESVTSRRTTGSEGSQTLWFRKAAVIETGLVTSSTTAFRPSSLLMEPKPRSVTAGPLLPSRPGQPPGREYHAPCWLPVWARERVTDLGREVSRAVCLEGFVNTFHTLTKGTSPGKRSGVCLCRWRGVEVTDAWATAVIFWPGGRWWSRGESRKERGKEAGHADTGDHCSKLLWNHLVNTQSYSRCQRFGFLLLPDENIPTDKTEKCIRENVRLWEIQGGSSNWGKKWVARTRAAAVAVKKNGHVWDTFQNRNVRGW